jgi:hypothetical protein
MNAFTKTVRIGIAMHINANVYVKVAWDGKRLSITGVEGPMKNGDAKGSCGQIRKPDFAEFAPGWTQETADKLWSIWDRWHLNDMRAGCEHQRAAWDTSRKLELTDYTWTRKFHDQGRKAADGTLSVDEYAGWQTIVARVYAVTIGFKRPKTETPEIAALLAEGWIEAGKSEAKAAGWVYPAEHPDGLLSKPCPVCGYKYGTQWLHEDVPDDVLRWLADLPDADRQPAWV